MADVTGDARFPLNLAVGGQGPMVGIVVVDAASPTETHEDIAGAARAAESAGLDCLWAGDHLSVGEVPLMDSTLVLAACAAATHRIGIGTAVLVPSLRPAAWAARQVITLAQLTSPRQLQLGIAVGAGLDAEHRMAGFPARGRAARTDAFLAAMPALLAGRPADVTGPDGPVTVQLAAATSPPAPTVWVGGSGAEALRRVTRYADGWLAGLVTLTEFIAAAARLHDDAAAAGRSRPRLGLVCHVTFSAPGAPTPRDEAVGILQQAYGMDRQRAAHLAIAGHPDQVADLLQPFVAAGCEHIAFISDHGSWQQSCDNVAQVRAILDQ